MIELQDIYKIYRAGDSEVRALDGVSLQIDSGEFVSIVGQSGSGKSTLMNLLGCLDTPTRGAYLLDGSDVSSMSDNKLSDIRNRRIGFIFQGFNLVSSLSAMENVELPLIYRKMDRGQRKKLVYQSLVRVGLKKRLNHRPSEMSGGQQQRVAIARAIAASPPIIFADEPTGNLDSKSGEDVIRILRELNREGRTVILITHDNSIAQKSDRVIHIHDGKIVLDERLA
ncbi:MAG: ABC transporter ATP-binding protein [Clostridiales bacterium]|nr:ABC transporter ATP-binding protein [Clostridiales bacterium]